MRLVQPIDYDDFHGCDLMYKGCLDVYRASESVATLHTPFIDHACLFHLNLSSCILESIRIVSFSEVAEAISALRVFCSRDTPETQNLLLRSFALPSRKETSVAIRVRRSCYER